MFRSGVDVVRDNGTPTVSVDVYEVSFCLCLRTPFSYVWGVLWVSSPLGVRVCLFVHLDSCHPHPPT